MTLHAKHHLRHVQHVQAEEFNCISQKMADLQAAPKSYVEYDDVFKHVNSFGSYQKKVFFGTCMILVAQGIQYSHLVFVTGTPNFECATPNVTCGGVNRCCANCTTYKFDTMFTTMVSEWNLICDRAHIAAIIQSMFFVGMLVGSFLSGIASDAYGRRTVIFCTFGVMAACGVVKSFVDCESFFGLLRFGSGAFAISTTLSQYILMLEFIGPEYRTMAGNANNFFWASGTYISILIAYFIREWRTFVWVTSVPPFILYFFWKVFPESPRWLLAHGKLEKAHQLIMKFGGIKDDKELDGEVMKSMVEEIRNDQLKREKDEQKKHTPLDLLRTPKLRKWSLIIGFGWFTVAMTFFAIFVYVTHLPGDIYTILATRTSLSMLATPITWYLMKSIGRRLVQVSYMTLTGVVLLLILVIPEEYKMAITWLAVLGYVLTANIWSCVYLITTELFPTVLRNTAQGAGSTFARFGGIVAPFLLMLAQLPGSSIHLPMAIFGACAIVCGISSLWLPETALITLPQTIEEAEESPEKYGIPFLTQRREFIEAEEHETEQLQQLSYNKE